MYSLDNDCPFDFPFNIDFSTSDDSAGKFTLCSVTHCFKTFYPLTVSRSDYVAQSTFGLWDRRHCVTLSIVDDVESGVLPYYCGETF